MRRDNSRLTDRHVRGTSGYEGESMETSACENCGEPVVDLGGPAFCSKECRRAAFERDEEGEDDE